MRILYDLFIQLYGLGIRIYSLVNPKAKSWIAGRKNTFEQLEQFAKKHPNNIWIHCASVGEFEQGYPLIQRLKEEYPKFEILVSFFSPSGYNYVYKRYPEITVIYLPLDTTSNASRWLNTLKPSLAIFVKYEIWHHYYHEIKKIQVPLLLVSAIFWKELFFFKVYGQFFRRALNQVTHFFVQDETSKNLLSQISLDNVTINGDTRFERVCELKKTAYQNELIDNFRGQQRVFVAGSIWESDKEVVLKIIELLPADCKIIIAPHEIEHFNYKAYQNIDCTYFSENNPSPNAKILFLDALGHLSKIYRFADLVYIGGGFGKGIHNLLEAAVYNKPIIIGPNFSRFAEAKRLKSIGLVTSITGTDQLESNLERILNLPESVFEQNMQYFDANSHATEQILVFIKKHGFLD